MPKGGFKSITMNTLVYDHLLTQYSKHAAELRLIGVNSLSGFCQRVLFHHIANCEFDDLISSSEKKTLDKILGARND